MSTETEPVSGAMKLSTELLPPETLERSREGNKFEKIKCAKSPDLMFTEVRISIEALSRLRWL